MTKKIVSPEVWARSVAYADKVIRGETVSADTLKLESAYSTLPFRPVFRKEETLQFKLEQAVKNWLAQQEGPVSARDIAEYRHYAARQLAADVEYVPVLINYGTKTWDSLDQLRKESLQFGVGENIAKYRKARGAEYFWTRWFAEFREILLNRPDLKAKDRTPTVGFGLTEAQLVLGLIGGNGRDLNKRIVDTINNVRFREYLGKPEILDGIHQLDIDEVTADSSVAYDKFGNIGRWYANLIRALRTNLTVAQFDQILPLLQSYNLLDLYDFLDEFSMTAKGGMVVTLVEYIFKYPEYIELEDTSGVHNDILFKLLIEALKRRA